MCAQLNGNRHKRSRQKAHLCREAGRLTEESQGALAAGAAVLKASLSRLKGVERLRSESLFSRASNTAPPAVSGTGGSREEVAVLRAQLLGVQSPRLCPNAGV